MLQPPFRALAVLGLTIVLIVSPSCNQNQVPNRSEPTTGTDEVLDVSFCDLVASPEQYRDRRVRVRAVLCDCFENAQLFSIGCPSAKKVWIEGGQRPCSDQVRLPPSRRSASENPGEQIYGSWNFGVVAVGRLNGINGRFGHMGAFEHKFAIECLESSQLLDRKGFIPSAGTQEYMQIAAFEADGSK